MSKVTLKIGDILCVDPSLIKDEDMKIIGFKNDKVLLNHIYMRETAFYQIDDTKHLISHLGGDYYYVNGIKYDREDIIVPNPEENTQPITKDNIKEVLEFNNITDISVHHNSLGKKYCFSLSMKPDNWLDILEAIVGKLKPLPKFEEIVLKVGDKIKFMNICPTVIKSFDYVNQKVNYECGFDEFNNLNKGHIESVNGKSGIYKIPEFDFEQYLLDNGFKVEQGQHGIVLKFSYVSIYKSELLTGGNWDYQGSRIQPTPQNADILIAMANLAKDLK